MREEEREGPISFGKSIGHEAMMERISDKLIGRTMQVFNRTTGTDFESARPLH